MQGCATEAGKELRRSAKEDLGIVAVFVYPSTTKTVGFVEGGQLVD